MRIGRLSDARNMLIIYIILNAIACFIMPIETILTWIILNLGVGWMLLRYVNEKDGDEDDMTHRTYLKGCGTPRLQRLKYKRRCQE